MKIRNALSRFKYPKLLILLLTIILAYFLFKEKNFEPWHNFLSSLGYLGIFIAGMLYAYGFTAAPATAVLLILAKEQDSIVLSGLIAGIGSLVSDTILFKFIRHSFTNEIQRIAEQKLFAYLKSKINIFTQKYLLPIIGMIIIASPLPDEIGVTLLASSTISDKNFYVLSYILNTLGIITVLIIGSKI
ncbi:MAG: hypothetical protein WC310_03520 [Patescibacteria group bacterium]|jgi:uncharacterized membrane protein YdjX (TVP38/TMEM64 family)